MQSVNMLTRPRRQKRLCNCGQPVRLQNSYCDVCIKTGLAAPNLPKSLEQIKTPASRRQFLIRTRGHLCQNCQRAEWEGTAIPLELDHVDGNSSNNTNENLRLLCPNCHALTPTYKGRNKGNGRHARRERYAKGQSY